MRSPDPFGEQLVTIGPVRELPSAIMSVDFTHHVADESARFAAAARCADDLTIDVPTCPEWCLADLVWHLTEVQLFWGYALGEGVDGPEHYVEPARPADAELLTRLDGATEALLDGLQRDDDEPCWSWSPTGGTVAWVKRRQAQEALIHRVDAELAVGRSTEIDDALAADGVDEILRVMLDVGELPEWASFEPEPDHLVLDTGSRWWQVRLGRFTGTPPDGEALDVPALSVDDSGTASAPPGPNRLTASATELDLWLWGRAPGTAVEVTGDPDAAARLRATAADALGG